MRGGKAGRAMPEPVVVPHENAAVGMAHGYYLVTGRPQAVMVHVNVGMANALMGLLNAARDNVPIFFTSGRTPPTESGRLGSRDLPIHWGQEMYDQAGMLREYVKWDYELRYGEQVENDRRSRARDRHGRAARPGLPQPAARGAGGAAGRFDVRRHAARRSPRRRPRPRRTRSSARRRSWPRPNAR